MKNVKTVFVMFAAMLLSSATASAAAVAKHVGPTDFNATNLDHVQFAPVHSVLRCGGLA